MVIFLHCLSVNQWCHLFTRILLVNISKVSSQRAIAGAINFLRDLRTKVSKANKTLCMNYTICVTFLKS